MNRREFVQVGTAGTVGIVAGGMTACSASQWVQTALNDIPAIISAVTAILNIVAAAQGAADPAAIAKAQQLGAEAKNDLTVAQSLISGYSASPSDTTLQKIDAALLDVQANLAGIEGALHVSNQTTQAAISAGVSAAIVLVVSFQLIIPPPATPVPAPTPAVAAHAAARKAIHAAAKSGDQSLAMKVAFNEALAAAGASQYAI